MPQNSNFRLPRGHRFFAQNGSYGYGAKSRWGPPRVHLGAYGVPLASKKCVKTVKNHGGDPLGSILGQWGPIGSKKCAKTVKNYHAPKFEFSITPRSSVCRKKWN